MIYADNAATTKLAPEAFEAMKYFLVDNYANPSQPYSFSREAKHAIKQSRQTIAECINADPEEIFFTSGGSEGDNWAVKCSGADTIITSCIEHHAVLNACHSCGAEVIELSADDTGRVNPSELEAVISGKNILVSVMLANNETGTIEPIHELAEISHRHNAVIHTDAVQAVGHIPVDVRALGVDMLTASGHKFNGVRGVGFQYVRKGTRLHALIHGGGQERSMRAGTENTAGIVGMAIALERNRMDMERNMKHLRNLEAVMTGRLEAHGLDFVRNGGGLPGLLSLSFRGADGEMLLHRLDLMGVCVSTGSACNGNSNKLSHVIRNIHVPEDYARGTIRISLGKYNTEDEAITIADSIAKILIRRIPSGSLTN